MGPEVQLPGGDVLPPGIGGDVVTLRKLGESCGSCLCPPTYTMGECDQFGECVHNPMIADAPGICMEPGRENNVNLVSSQLFQANFF